MRALAISALLLALGCGSSNDAPAPEPVLPTPPDAGTMDISREGLARFAKGGDYLGWRSESGIHASAGPHGGQVRTFFNATLAASLDAASLTHPVGSVVVKELWGNGQAIIGHAINVKITDAAGKDSWLFAELSAPEYTGFYGVGDPTCHGCHSSGRDYVRSPWPPR
jgi:hypothetical protein